MFLLYPFYAIGSLFFTLLTYILSPILALLPDKNGHLPKYLYYFQTYDEPLGKGYWADVQWLCRNPAYGFDLYVFGFKYDPAQWRKVYYKNGLYISVCRNGAFSVGNDKDHPLNDRWYLPPLKLGWKAFNFHDDDGNPVAYGMSGRNQGRMPFCFSFV
jgi:hypothetical protein